MKKRILNLLISASVLLTSVFSLASCSKAPEYGEIEERFTELVEASYSINQVLFGEGLPTYERVYDPRNSLKYYDNGGARYYYYEIEDETLGKIIAYRSSWSAPYAYAQFTDEPISDKTPVYENAEKKIYYYSIEYTEKIYDFYYSAEDPENYEYVSDESKYLTVDAIKADAEKVYSSDYLKSIYEALFTGAVTLDSTSGLSARYIEYEHNTNGTMLMQSSEYKPLVTETRIFDFSTAKIVKPSSKKLVNIEVETYLKSNPEDRSTVRVTLVLENGNWYLDSGTY